MTETISGPTKPISSAARTPYRGLEGLEFAAFEWADVFDHERLFHDLGRIPLTEFEANH